MEQIINRISRNDTKSNTPDKTSPERKISTISDRFDRIKGKSENYLNEKQVKSSISIPQFKNDNVKKMYFMLSFSKSSVRCQ